MSKTIEQAAEDYQAIATDVNGGLSPYYVDSFIAGAKHQKELSDAREKLLLDVIGEMQMSLEYYKNLKKEYLSLGGLFNPELMTLSDKALQEIFNPAIKTLSSVAKKLEGL